MLNFYLVLMFLFFILLLYKYTWTLEYLNAYIKQVQFYVELQLYYIHLRQILVYLRCKRVLNTLCIWILVSKISFHNWQLRRCAKEIGIPVDVLQHILSMNLPEDEYVETVNNYIEMHKLFSDQMFME